MKRFLFLVFFPLLCYSQFVDFKHFSSENGLPSSEVFSCIQDTFGYMWFGTLRGVSRFDGVSFYNYTSKDGLPSNSVIKLFRDYKGFLWLSFFDGSLVFFDGSKFNVFPKNDTLKALLEHNHLNNLFFDSSGNLWVSDQSSKIVFFNKKLVPFVYKPKVTYTGLYIKKINNNYIYQYYKGLESDSVFFVDNDSIKILVTTKRGFRHNFFSVSDSIYVISVANNLFVIKNNKIIFNKTYSTEITSIYVDKDLNLWIGFINNGVCVYRISENFRLKAKFLEEFTISAVFQDFQGGFWFPTNENAVFYIPAFNFFKVNLPENYQIINRVFAHKNQIYFINFNQNIYSFDLDNFQLKLLLPKNTFPVTISNIVKTSQDSIWLIGRNIYLLSKNNLKIFASNLRVYSYYYDNTNLYFSSTKEIYVIKKDTFYTLIHNLNKVITSIYVKDSVFWIGTVDGLYKFHNKTLTFLGKQNSSFAVRINSINGFENLLAIGTNGNGLFFYNSSNGKILVYNESNGFISNYINTIAVSDNEFYIGTNKGLVKFLVLKFSNDYKLVMLPIDENDGLWASDIKDIASTTRHLFLATSKGLYYFDKFKFQKKFIVPKIFLDSIVIGENVYKNGNKLDFGSNTKNIVFYFKAISFSAGNKLIYKYKFLNIDEEWTFTKDNFIKFTELPAGKYSLVITASVDGINWSDKPLFLNFIVRKKFTQTVYFYLLLLFLTILIFVLTVFIRYRQLKHDIKLQRLALSSEQKALRSQMNPHFIFNALNSIRRFIYETSIDKADFFLTRFAQLMRNVLDNSKYEFISLQQEIDTLKIYVELEKMRFDKSFDFKLLVDNRLNLSSTYIPPMIIQPIVENAIWHGISPLEKNGQLTISFEYLDNFSFCCIVDDNGIGRQRSAQISKNIKTHKSTGISNLLERLNILNQISSIKIDLEIIDKYDQDNNPTGTKVIIKFSQVTFSPENKTVLENFLDKIRLVKK